MILRRSLILVLTSAVVIAAAPSASAPSASALFSSFAPVTRVLLNDPRELSPAEKMRAAAINNEVPAHPELAVAAARFSLAAVGADPLNGTSALDCLTAAIYYEAANEPITGQRAVAQVILNRLRHPAFPNNVCDVVFEGSERATGCQFTFTCDGSLGRRPSAALWQRARSVAGAALGGYVEASVGHATHYHASYVVPYWAAKLTKLTTIGTHIFYQWNGSWAQPSAFRDRYDASEVLPQKARVALAGYLTSPDADAAQFIVASSLPDTPPAERVLLSAPAPMPPYRLKNAPSNVDALPATSLKVGKAELIDNRARLKEDQRPDAGTKETTLAD